MCAYLNLVKPNLYWLKTYFGLQVFLLIEII